MDNIIHTLLIKIFPCGCDGGILMTGVMMHSNPSSYGDYDEVWEDCNQCNGRGFIRPTKYHLRDLYYDITHKYVEEEEIPF